MNGIFIVCIKMTPYEGAGRICLVSQEPRPYQILNLPPFTVDIEVCIML